MTLPEQTLPPLRTRDAVVVKDDSVRLRSAAGGRVLSDLGVTISKHPEQGLRIEHKWGMPGSFSFPVSPHDALRFGQELVRLASEQGAEHD